MNTVSKQDTTTFRLQLSFVVMILLILLIAGFGVYNVSRINNHLTTVSENIQEKLSLATSMRNNARERTISLQVMVLTDDPFLRDEYWMKFNKFGAQFARARMRLLEIINSDTERNIFKKQREITQRIVPKQLYIAELATREALAEANLLLIEEALPMQNEVFKIVDKLYDFYDQQMEKETQLARDAYDNVLNISWIAGTAAVLFALLTAAWITKRIKKYQTNLQSLNSNLEYMVEIQTKELTLSEKRQRNIVENAIEGIIALNNHGVIESVNPAAKRIFDFTEKELIGVSIDKLIYPNENNSSINIPSHANIFDIDKLVDKEIELFGQKKDGTRLPILLGVSRNASDRSFHYSCFIRDITEQKRVEKLKNEFVSTVSHELRTPLTSIRGSLGLVVGGALGTVPDKIYDLLKLADNNVHRLLSIINDILDIQKIESGMMEFILKPIDLLPLLKQAMQDNMGYAKQFNINLIFENETDATFVMADETRISQVLANLLSNAIKFSPAGETVTLKLEAKDNFYRIWVIDNGTGISEEFQKKLFDKFTQEDGSSTRSKGGTGLGLPIVKMILENHQSDLQYITQQGQGAKFYFDLLAIESNTALKTGTE